MDIGWIQTQIRHGNYLWSQHADQERRHDDLEISDIEEALLEGKVLEQYPLDRRGSSCLIAGQFNGRPVHIVCGQNKQGLLVIITVYVPTLPKWKTAMERS